MKIAIVTGASSGLGREFVRQITRLYKNLDEIWVVARRAERLEELKEKLPVYIRVFAGDMEEDLIYKQRVIGSSPIGPIYSIYMLYAAVAELADARDLKSRG